jgi:glycosyltransferase involved in cell wall biosynthesis
VPEVSILIPTHNRAEVIKAAVDSALSQTHKDIEVIVYDDGSDEKDGYYSKDDKLTKISAPTDSVLAKVKDSRFKYVKNKANRGVAHARNELMKLANGEYIMWLDSDDRCNIYRVEVCLDAIKTYNAPYVRTMMTTFAKEKDKSWLLPPLLVYRGGVSFATIMFRAENALEFDVDYTCAHEDMDWELRYAYKYGRAVQVPLTLYCVGRRSQDRLTMRYKNNEHHDDFLRCKKKYEKQCERIMAKMDKDGKTKMPLSVPWDFMEKYQSRFYNTSYKKQAQPGI